MDCHVCTLLVLSSTLNWVKKCLEIIGEIWFLLFLDTFYNSSYFWTVLMVPPISRPFMVPLFQEVFMVPPISKQFSWFLLFLDTLNILLMLWLWLPVICNWHFFSGKCYRSWRQYYCLKCMQYKCEGNACWMLIWAECRIHDGQLFF